jgi:uncharacterized protein with PIN domain
LRPFSRCTRCNAAIEALPRALAEPLVPPRVAARHAEFWRCPRCGRIYWAGTHLNRMRRTLEGVLGLDGLDGAPRPGGSS